MRIRSVARSETVLGFLLLLPPLVFLAVFIFGPFLSNIFLSFERLNVLRPQGEFIGLTNYRSLLRNPDFWRYLWQGLVFTSSSTALQVILGMGLAILLNQKIRFRGLFRALFVLPWAVPNIVAAATWRFLYWPDGIVSYVLVSLGIIDQQIDWLGTASTAMPAVVAVSVWRFMPFMFLVILAGLQQIPAEYYESASIDGASFWQQFLHITLPGVRTILLVGILLRFVWLFNHFDLIFLLTGGGPSRRTNVLPIEVYNISFVGSSMGMGAAITTLMIAVLMVFFVVYYRLRCAEERV
jgi:ABC-type sugar transport system permease subunit